LGTLSRFGTRGQAGGGRIISDQSHRGAVRMFLVLRAAPQVKNSPMDI